MKNTTFAYTYTIGLTITHPARELSYLAVKLNKIPNGVAEKTLGKDWDRSKVPVYEEIKTNNVHLELNHGWHNALLEDDLPESIEKLIDSLQPCKQLLSDLIDSEGKIQCNIGWFVDKDIGASLSPELLRKMADLKLALEISVYTGKDADKIQGERLGRVSEKIRDILHKYDPSKIVDKSAPLSELYYDPYQDLFDLLPYFIKAHASADTIAKELKEELAYFNRTNTLSLKEFEDYDALAAELAELMWE
jgi:hypothetical protein